MNPSGTAVGADPNAPQPAAAAGSGRANESRSYLRGSSLLFGGRGVGLLLNLAVQTLIVRSLSKGEYGAFAYGLGMASVGASVVLLGLDKATSRFVPMYQERGEERKALGTILLSIGVVLAFGLLLVLAVLALREHLLGAYVRDPRALSLLLILIALAPMQALDSLLQGTASIYAGAGTIFVRRHVLGPGLKLAAIVLVMAVGGGVYQLAYTYVVAEIVGIGLYLTVLVRIFRRQGIWSRYRLTTLEYPVREVLGYSTPLLASEVLALLTGSLSVVLLEYLEGTSAIAEFRSVLPVARLNVVVFQSFAVLFIPLASRLFARGDLEGINQLYWRTATWVAVLTFPVFVATSALAEPLTVLLFGAQYASSGALLAVLAVGFYVNAALGFNSYTLRVCAPVPHLVAIDATCSVIGLGASILLIRRYGAMGAALGSAFTLVLTNLLTHAALVAVRTGVRLLDWRFLRTYVLIAGGASGLMLVERLFEPPLYVSLLLTAAASVALLRLSRDALQVEDTFPELLRVPLLRALVRPTTRRRQGSADDPEAVALAAALRANASRYLPGAPGAAATTLVRCERRNVSRLYTFDLHVGGLRESVMVKVPVDAAGLRGAAAAAGTPGDRPRLAPVADPTTRGALEHAALLAIHGHFATLGDPRLGAVRVLDYLEEHRAVVMQRVGEENLRHLVLRSWRPRRGGTTRLRAAFGNAGAWLRHYHALPHEPHVRARHAGRADFVAHVEELAHFLGDSPRSAPFFRGLARAVAASARTVLPASLPLGRSHGDFALRNVLVAPGARVTVLDTLGRHSTAVYEDIGYFLTDVKCNPLHLASSVSGTGRRRVADLEAAFLAGYFGDEPVPARAVALYEVLAILSRWASLRFRRDRAAGAGSRLVLAAQLLVMSRRFRGQLLERLRVLGVESRPADPTSTPELRHAGDVR